MKDGRASAFEVVNATLREIYIGVFVAPTTLDDIRKLYRQLPPDPIRHWRREQQVSYSVLAEDLSGDDALAFMRIYAPKIRDQFWTVFTE
jgi:hypothetical protein